MHSALTRLQNVFGFFTTVAFFVGALTALSVFLHPGRPSAELSVSNVQVVRGRPHYYSTTKQEYAYVRFDLDADFSSLFTWNTKQLFVYVLASYPTSSPLPDPTAPISLSESLIWDAIIPGPPTSFSYTTLMEKYFSKGPKNILSSNSNSKSSSKSKPKSSKGPSKVKTVAKPGILKLKNQKPKYQITDPGGKMAELENVTLVVGWNVQPWVGALQWDGWSMGGRWTEGKGEVGRSGAFEFPALKGAKKEQEKDTGATGGGAGA